MSSVNSKETVSGLVRLQRLDDDVFRVQRRLREGPALVERRGEKHRLSAQKLQADREKIQHYRATLNQLELDLQSKETEIQKIRDQQQTARTNQEYRALDEHVKRIQAAGQEIEDRILDGFSKLESAEAETASYGRQVEEVEKEQQAFAAQWAKDEAAYTAELKTFTARRNEHSATLPKDAVTIYDRALKARDGVAVTPVEGKVCGGCSMNLLPNSLARLHSLEELVSCNNCMRILFVPGVHDRA